MTVIVFAAVAAAMMGPGPWAAVVPLASMVPEVPEVPEVREVREAQEVQEALAVREVPVDGKSGW